MDDTVTPFRMNPNQKLEAEMRRETALALAVEWANHNSVMDHQMIITAAKAFETFLKENTP